MLFEVRRWKAWAYRWVLLKIRISLNGGRVILESYFLSVALIALNSVASSMAPLWSVKLTAGGRVTVWRDPSSKVWFWRAEDVAMRPARTTVYTFSGVIIDYRIVRNMLCSLWANVGVMRGGDYISLEKPMLLGTLPEWKREADWRGYELWWAWLSLINHQRSIMGGE